MLYMLFALCVCAKHEKFCFHEEWTDLEWVWQGYGRSRKRVRELLNKIYLDLLQVAHRPNFCRIIKFCVPVHIRIFSAARVT